MSSPLDPWKLLIINPNTTKSMTDSVETVVDAVLSKQPLLHIECTFFTSPSSTDGGSIASINSPEDAEKTAEYCMPHLQSLIDSHDAFLVACYSEHPLVGMIQRDINSRHPQVGKQKFVTGIFEASVDASLASLSRAAKGEDDDVLLFAIVTTGKIWEVALSSAITRLEDGKRKEEVFAGVETTGLTAVELHDLPEELVRSRLSEAASRLVSRESNSKRKVRAICLGCAGMVGFESAVQEGVYRVLGNEVGKDVEIVDGIVAGVEGLLRQLQTR